MLSNFKDTITSICGLIVAIGGAILGISVGGVIVLPVVATTIVGVLVAIATALIGYFTGKAPNGALKTDSQVIAGNQK